MKPTSQYQSASINPTTASTAAAPGASDSGQKVSDKVSNAAQAVREHDEDRGAEKIDQAKRKVSQAYDQASRSLNEQYEKAMDYGRENPGKTTLIAFGVGVGVGLLVASNFSAPHSRRRRVVEPVINALSTIASELFR